MTKKILITWWSGFIWKNIIEKLNLENCYDIYNLSPTHVEWTTHIKMIKNELFNFENLDKDFDYIIHTLALSNEKYCSDLKNAEKINIEFTKELIYFAKKQNILKKFIFLSSIIIYDNENKPPVSENDKLNFFYWNYSFTKWISENYVNFLAIKFKIPFIIFRVSNLYWPWQSFIDSPFLIPSKINEWLENKNINVYNLEPIRDWLYIDDAVNWIIEWLNSNYNWIYNLWSWYWVSVKEILEIIAEELNVKYSSQEIPVNWPLKFYSNINKIKNDLNWEPKVLLKDWIKKTINYIKKLKYENSNN